VRVVSLIETLAATGAQDENRTHELRITSALACQKSGTRGVNHYYQPLENAARNTELLLQEITQPLNNYC
jgi:hypothetical protein